MIKYGKIILIILIMFININVSALSDNNVDTYVVCSNIAFPYQLIYIIRTIYNVIRYALPIILIIMGMLDFSKVILSKDDKAIKKAQKSFISRLLALVLCFLIFYLVEFTLNVLTSRTEVKDCIKCVFLDNNCNYIKGE